MVKFKIDRKENPEYYRIRDDFDQLIEEWDILNGKLGRFKVHVIYSPRLKRRLVGIGEDIQELQKRWLEKMLLRLSFMQIPIISSRKRTDTLIFNIGRGYC